MKRFVDIGADALNAQERAVLAAWDRGGTVESISADQNIGRDRVRTILTRFVITGRPERASTKALITANARYVAAVAATGKRFS